MLSMESDFVRYASLLNFPRLPRNLCSNQANLQVKHLPNKLQDLNPNAKQNIMNAMGDVRPSHSLDQK
jgi:tRNA 2-thiocytidine biosynthesis protein TtcA